MARPKRYETAAQKQKAYRERKKLEAVPMTRTPSLGHVHIVDPNPPRTKIEELRELIEKEHEKPSIAEPVVLKTYRSDTGMVITREQWEKREEEKRRAKEKGFEIDAYSQT